MHREGVETLGMRMYLPVWLLLLQVMTGCVPLPGVALIDETELPSDTIQVLAPGEAVTIVSGAFDDAGKAPLCVSESLHASNPAIRRIPPEEFRDSLFPWFEKATAPRREEELAAVMSRPLVKARLEELNLRYLVEVNDPSTSEGSFKGPHLILAGVGWAERESEITASVWDLKEAAHVGSARVSTSGHNVVATWIIFSGIFLPATETTACQELGRGLAALLTGEDAPPEVSIEEPPRQ